MKRVLACLGAVVVGSAPGVAHADSWALLLGGKGSYATLSEEQMSSAFGGYFAHYDHRVSVAFPGSDDFISSTKVGADNLYNAVYDSRYAGPKTIGGVSEGAPAVFEVLRRLEADRAAGRAVPSRSELNVAVYGMPSGPFLGGYKIPKVVSPYNAIIVKAEYDGIADFPDNPLNLLAVLNAVMGADQLHVKQANFDILGEATEYTMLTNTAGGTTTTILIPTAVLPILAPMVKAGASPAAIARMDKMLRPIIDSAYKRPTWTVGIPPTLTGPPGSTVLPPIPAATMVSNPPTAAAGGAPSAPAAAYFATAPVAAAPPAAAPIVRTAPVTSTPVEDPPAQHVVDAGSVPPAVDVPGDDEPAAPDEGSSPSAQHPQQSRESADDDTKDSQRQTSPADDDSHGSSPAGSASASAGSQPSSSHDAGGDGNAD